MSEEINKLLCAWCGEPFTDDMVEVYVSSGGCDTCDIGSGAEIEIRCPNKDCPKYNKVIYRKDTTL